MVRSTHRHGLACSVALACLGAGVAATVPALAAPHQKAAGRGITYAGSTSQSDPIVIQLSRDGRRVTRIVSEYEAPCHVAPEFDFNADRDASLSIGKDGSFRAEISTRYTSRSRLVESISGKVNGVNVAGRWRAEFRVVDSSGRLADSCTADFTFKAVSAARHTFGGATSQQFPVTLELGLGNTRVDHLRIGWEGQCGQGDTFVLGDVIGGWAVRAGHFGRDFTQTYSRSSDGSKISYTYRVRGRITGVNADGTFSVQVTRRGASGELLFSCKTGNLRWRAVSG